MDDLEDYFLLQSKIYEYFGYTEDWVKIPLEDSREYFWKIIGSESSGSVEYSTDRTFEDESVLYRNEIYTQRFLSKWVYRGKDFTMVCVDTHVDGNKFLQIFDNRLEIKGAKP